MKNKFLLSTFILMLSGMVTKVLGLVIKIIFTRIVGNEAISLYTIVMPTYSLLLTICTLAMPSSIAKLVAEEKNTKLLNSALIIIIVLNFSVIFLMFIFAPILANNLLKEPKAYYLLIAMSFTLPFASIACILKGYFYGKQKMVPHVVSNTVEQIIRLLIVIIVIPKLVKISYIHAAVGLVFTSFFTELASIIVFLLFMKKHDVINLAKINFNKQDSKDILNLSIPLVASRIVSNICYFFEPIILTNILLYLGYSNTYILREYGAYNAYAISTLLIPSFFINAIALAIVPEIAKFLKQKNYNMVKKRTKEAFLFTFLIGIFFSFTILVFRDKLLIFLYNSNLGSNYIKYLAPTFILFYFEGIFNSFFQATGNNKITLKITIISSISKVVLLILLCFLNIGIYALLINEVINIIITVLMNYYYFKKYINNSLSTRHSF